MNGTKEFSPDQYCSGRRKQWGRGGLRRPQNGGGWKTIKNNITNEINSGKKISDKAEEIIFVFILYFSFCSIINRL